MADDKSSQFNCRWVFCDDGDETPSNISVVITYPSDQTIIVDLSIVHRAEPLTRHVQASSVSCLCVQPR